MDLPFAVDSPEQGQTNMLAHSTASSLMTASCRGSFSRGSFLTSEQSGIVVMSPPLETETIDFTFVHAESDADEVDIVIDAGVMPCDGIERPRGDILAVLLSGSAQQNGGELIVVSPC
jgi:hypothetical protein